MKGGTRILIWAPSSRLKIDRGPSNESMGCGRVVNRAFAREILIRVGYGDLPLCFPFAQSCLNYKTNVCNSNELAKIEE